MEREVEYSELMERANNFDRMRTDENGAERFRPPVEKVIVNGEEYYYYLLREEIWRNELGNPHSLVFRMVSKDPKTGKRLMLLGLRECSLGEYDRQRIASEEIRAFKAGK